MVSTWLQTNEVAKIDKTGFVKCLNDLNKNAIVLRFYADNENDLLMDAWYPELYGRAAFGVFIDILNHDTQLLFDEQLGLKAYFT